MMPVHWRAAQDEQNQHSPAPTPLHGLSTTARQLRVVLNFQPNSCHHLSTPQPSSPPSSPPSPPSSSLHPPSTTPLHHLLPKCVLGPHLYRYNVSWLLAPLRIQCVLVRSSLKAMMCPSALPQSIKSLLAPHPR